MKVVITGRPLSGRATLFSLISGIPKADLPPGKKVPGGLANILKPLTHTSPLPDPMIEQLIALYKPKRTTPLLLETILPAVEEEVRLDAAVNLAATRFAASPPEASLLVVVDAFRGGADRVNSTVADIVEGDAERIQKRLDGLSAAAAVGGGKKANRSDRPIDEVPFLESCLEAANAGLWLCPVAAASTANFGTWRILDEIGCLSQRRAGVVFNHGDCDIPLRAGIHSVTVAGATLPCVSAALSFEAEVSAADAAAGGPSGGDELLEMYGLGREALVCASGGVGAVIQASSATAPEGTSVKDHAAAAAGSTYTGWVRFYTVGQDEVRTWLLSAAAATVPKAGRAIHTALEGRATGANVTRASDVIAQQNMDIPPTKVDNSYVVKDGDILHILT